MPPEFRCEDCPEHSGTKATIRHLQEDRAECRTDRGKLWDAMDEHNRRIGERVTIKVALWTSGIAVTIFLTVVSIVLTTSSRIEEKLDAVTADVKVIQAVSMERALHERQHQDLMNEIKLFREQESRDFQEGKTMRDWAEPYGKPGR